MSVAPPTNLDQLLYHASHDLRAPLRGINHLSEWIEEDLELLGEPARYADVTQHLKLLRARVQRLERLIEGLLEYSRAGRDVFEGSPGEGLTLIQLCIEALHARHAHMTAAEAARVKLVAGPGAEMVLPDEMALRAVLAHLLANAARYGAAGRDAVIVTVSARHTAEGRVEVAVSDDGPGIDASHHDRIWELFQTLEPRDRTEATGVGLTIVQRVVERRGGRVGVESGHGAGAAFRFTWPLPPEADLRGPDAQAIADVSALTEAEPDDRPSTIADAAGVGG